MFREAAALLSGQFLAHDDAQARALVQRMGFADALDGAQSAAGTVRPAAYFEAAARMSRIFELGSPDAPGFVCIGGTADPAAYGLAGYPVSNVSGRGRTLNAAFTSCVGESVEYLSQLEWGNEAIRARHAVDSAEADARLGQLSDLLAAAGGSPEDWMPGRSLATGKDTMLPADLVIRRRGRAEALRGFGSGCAAGETLAHATRSALLELIERDAVALWWIGGRRGAALEQKALQALGVIDFLDGLRQGAGRPTWLLDISTDLGVPCVVAMSADETGGGLVCGMSARLTLEAAAKSAVLELCQMELARHLVLVKLKHGGEAALAETDRRHLRRMTGIDVERCALLFPERSPLDHSIAVPDGPEGQRDALVRRLAAHGIESFLVDLTREAIAVPVVRCFAPGLQALPLAVTTRRLRHVVQATGGTHHYTEGIEIL
jgi:ribosomal protein S12 methylthiotransferase accessory factor